MSKILINGIAIHYEKVGQGSHIVLLLPGALGIGRSDFPFQLDGFDKDKFTLIGWDPRGYGQSRPPLREFSPSFLQEDAEDAAALMEALGYSYYSLLGFSDGANVGSIMAAKWSKRIHKLVIFGGNSFTAQEEIALYRAVRDLSQWTPESRDPYVSVYGMDTFEKLWHGWIDNFIKMIESTDGDLDLFRKDLENIASDTLIIHGDKDPFIREYHVKEFHEKIKGSRLVRFEDAGHYVQKQCPVEFNRTVQAFLLEDGISKYLLQAT